MFLLIVLTAGAYLPSPLYTGYRAAFGFGDLTMTLVYATFALVSAPALLLFGSAADTVGPRVVLRISVAVAGLASVCFALASGPGWLLAGRAAQGLALGAATGAATALITARAPAGDRARASVSAGMAFVGGTAVGPVVAGVLAQYAPAPAVLPYVAHLVALAAAWRRVATLAPEGPRPGRWRPTRPRVPAGQRRVFGTAAATGFLAWTAAGLFLAVIPTTLSRQARIDNLAVVGGIVGAVLACSVLTQPLVARWGARPAQLSGLGALLLGLGLLALTGGGSLPVTALAALAAGTGHGLAYGGSGAAVDTAVPDGRRAALNAALYLAFYLGSAIPAVAVGLLTLWHPLTTAISGLSAAAAVSVPLVALALVRTGRTLRTPIPDQRSVRAADGRSPADLPSVTDAPSGSG